MKRFIREDGPSFVAVGVILAVVGGLVAIEEAESGVLTPDSYSAPSGTYFLEIIGFRDFAVAEDRRWRRAPLDYTEEATCSVLTLQHLPGGCMYRVQATCSSRTGPDRQIQYDVDADGINVWLLPQAKRERDFLNANYVIRDNLRYSLSRAIAEAAPGKTFRGRLGDLARQADECEARSAADPAKPAHLPHADVAPPPLDKGRSAPPPVAATPAPDTSRVAATRPPVPPPSLPAAPEVPRTPDAALDKPRPNAPLVAATTSPPKESPLGPVKKAAPEPPIVPSMPVCNVRSILRGTVALDPAVRAGLRAENTWREAGCDPACAGAELAPIVKTITPHGCGVFDLTFTCSIPRKDPRVEQARRDLQRATMQEFVILLADTARADNPPKASAVRALVKKIRARWPDVFAADSAVRVVQAERAPKDGGWVIRSVAPASALGPDVDVAFPDLPSRYCARPRDAGDGTRMFAATRLLVAGWGSSRALFGLGQFPKNPCPSAGSDSGVVFVELSKSTKLAALIEHQELRRVLDAMARPYAALRDLERDLPLSSCSVTVSTEARDLWFEVDRDALLDECLDVRQVKGSLPGGAEVTIRAEQTALKAARLNTREESWMAARGEKGKLRTRLPALFLP